MPKENKTQPTAANVYEFINNVNDDQKKADSLLLIKWLKEITHEEPVLWGPSIIGFGTYHYKYKSGREGDMPIVAFSPRKQNLTIYLIPGFEKIISDLQYLGKFTTGKGCLYIKRLSEVDTSVLREIIQNSVDRLKKQGLS